MLAHRSSQDFDPAHLCMLGISHRTVALRERKQYALNTEARSILYGMLKKSGASFCIILSTCNRTEIYVDRKHADEVFCIWSEILGLSSEDQDRIQKQTGYNAVMHLFSVASGIDSQIPGDLQIIQQVRDAFAEAKDNGLGSGLLEKLINQAIYCSKRVKSETRLSTGTSSVASAVTMLVRKYFRADHKIVIFGTGKIGKISCRNLIKTIPGSSITLVNRTDAKAEDLAQILGVNSVSYEHRDATLRQADIIIVATASPTPVIAKDHIRGEKLLLDLTVPSAIDLAVTALPGVQIRNLDALSQLVSEHLGMRETELDHATAIVEQEVTHCQLWWHRRSVYTETAPKILPKTRRRYA